MRCRALASGAIFLGAMAGWILAVRAVDTREVRLAAEGLREADLARCFDDDCQAPRSPTELVARWESPVRHASAIAHAVTSPRQVFRHAVVHRRKSR
jgi:hypothetical protein